MHDHLFNAPRTTPGQLAFGQVAESFTDGAIYADASRDGQCAWFAGCDRVAVVAVTHPILGSVPTCAKCAAWVEASR